MPITQDIPEIWIVCMLLFSFVSCMSALGQLADNDKSGAKILSLIGTYPIALFLVALMMLVQPESQTDTYVTLRTMAFLLFAPFLVSLTSKNPPLFSVVNALLGVLFFGAALVLVFT